MNKNNETDKPAIDALFARKLGNATLPTKADGFARLQARMGQPQADRKPGFMVWRNPNVQQFLALAACLLLVCLFGWVYLSDDASERVQGNQVATTNAKRPTPNVPATPPNNRADRPTAEQPDELTSATTNPPTEQLAAVGSENRTQNQASNVPGRQNANAITPVPRTELAQNNPAPQRQTQQAQLEQPVPKKVVDAAPVSPAPDQVAAVKPAATHRVLVVTIAEPERLVAARQAVKMDVMETALASATTPEKAQKRGFWEQVRRVKQGEAFARPDGSDDERGLLNRAFDGLKNSIEKDKTARQ